MVAVWADAGVGHEPLRGIRLVRRRARRPTASGSRVRNQQPEQRLPGRAIQVRGFTERQARFLAFALEQSGVCLARQYRAFAGIAHVRQAHGFFDRLVHGGFATTDLAAPRARGADLSPPAQSVVPSAKRVGLPAPEGDECGARRCPFGF